MNQIICASLSHTDYWYEVAMLKYRRYPISFNETGSACSCHSERFEKSLLRKISGVCYSRPSRYSSPSEPLIPDGASLKVVEFWQPTNHDNIGAASICSSVQSVQNFIGVTYYSWAVLVFIHR